MHDPKVQKLPAEEFRHKLLACVDGEQNEFSRFIRVSDGRVFAREWADIRSRIFERDDFTCAYCGQRGGRLECDHIIPVSRGGATTEQNLTTSCFSCNRKKRDKTAEEWRHSRA
jgi:hypothetical protein